MQQRFVKSYQELSVRLHSSLSLFVFLQTVIGCWMPSDDCNRRGKSRRNAVRPLCLSYSLILLTLSLCCVRQDKQTGHSCSIQRSSGSGWACQLSNVVNKRKLKMTDGPRPEIKNKWKNGSLWNQHSRLMASLVHLALSGEHTSYSEV